MFLTPVMLFFVLGGGIACDEFETARKIAHIQKPGRQCSLCNGISAVKQTHCIFNADGVCVFHKGFMEIIFKKAAKIFW